MDNSYEPTEEDIDALVKTYGGNPKKTPKSDAQKTSEPPPTGAVAQPNASDESEDELVDRLVETYGGNNKKKETQGEAPVEGEKPMSEEEKAYRQQIEEYMPQAREEAAKQGKFGSLMSGFGRDPIIGQNLVGAMYDVEALFRGKGNTYAERRRDLGAREEAALRAAG